MGLDAMTLVFWMLSFKPTFSLSSSTFIKRLFSSSSLSAIRVVSSVYLRLLIFLLEILIPACVSSSKTTSCRVYYPTSLYISIIQFSSGTQLGQTLCNSMDYSTPRFPVYHQLLEFTQTNVHCVGDAIQPSHPLSSPSPPAFQSCPGSGYFPMSQSFASGGQSIGVSASVPVLPMNIQNWFPLRLTGLISV